MAGTTMAATKAALKTMATTAVGTGIQVAYGDPGDTARSEMVYIGAAVENDHEPVSLRSGRRQRDEAYTVSLKVEVSNRGTPEGNEARAVALGALIETAIADDPKLGATPGVLWAVVSGLSLDTSEAGDTPRAVLTINVEVHARLL